MGPGTGTSLIVTLARRSSPFPPTSPANRNKVWPTFTEGVKEAVTEPPSPSERKPKAKLTFALETPSRVLREALINRPKVAHWRY
jgi:hypothetical protein